MNSIEKANEKELVVAIKQIVNENEYLRRENRELEDRLRTKPVNIFRLVKPITSEIENIIKGENENGK